MLHYIYHSCFVVETSDCLIVYDYWKDPEGVLARLLAEAEADGRTVYFIVSHFHEDHYNPQVVEWCQMRKSWFLLPSYDTVKRRRIDKENPLLTLRFGESYELPHFRLQAYRSTDVGVSTVVTLPDGTTFYHAGDNNNWFFPTLQAGPKDQPSADKVKITPEQMDKLFLSTIREVRADHPELHHVMFPVDPRLGQNMLRGALQLLDMIAVKHFHPMHYAAATNTR